MDLWVKLSANNKQLTPYADTLMAYTKMLKAAGVDAIELSGVDFGYKKAAERAYYLSEALAIRSVGVPVILVGGLRERQQMEDILAAGIPMVALSRPLIREPDLPRRMELGQEKAACIGCNGCMRLYRSEYKNCAFLPPSEQVRKIFGRYEKIENPAVRRRPGFNQERQTTVSIGVRRCIPFTISVILLYRKEVLIH
jgi:tRNA-dihydrouridine synthase